MDTLDSLLESIAFENFTTNIHVAGLLNGNVKDSNSNILTTTNNHEINRKTDALNRYFDNLISFNREYEKYRHQSRKSDSPSDQSSELSDQQSHNNVRRSTQVTQTQLIIKKILKNFVERQLNRSVTFDLQFTVYRRNIAETFLTSSLLHPHIFIVNVFIHH